jgi:hypothetical protein
MDLIAVITAAVVIALVFLGGFIGVDRLRTGWARAEAAAVMRRRQLQDVADRTEQLRSSIAELSDTIAARERQCSDLRLEAEKLKRDLDSRELPFRYTAVPIASGDMYGPTWRFVARQPALAEGAAPDHPAAQWGQGRGYIVGAVNQPEARSIMDRLLPRHRNFTIVAVGAIVGNAPTAQ